MIKNKVVSHVYSLEDKLSPDLLDNKIFPEVWIDKHKHKVEKYSVENKEEMILTYTNEFIEDRDLKRRLSLVDTSRKRHKKSLQLPKERF